MDPIAATRMAPNADSIMSMMPRSVQEALAKKLSPAELERINAPALPQSLSTSTHAPVPAGASFSDVLGKVVNDVNARQVAAGEAVNGMLTGDNVSIHQAVIAMEEASVSFQLMVEVRNKLLESYQELMRMQV